VVESRNELWRSGRRFRPGLALFDSIRLRSHGDRL
jgi:hypothetical protein